MSGEVGMVDWQEIVGAAPGLATEFGGKVVDSILVGAVVAWILALGKGRDKRIARTQIAEQVCRVFGMRLYRKPGEKHLTLEALPGNSLQGWASLERLQWTLDMHRAQLSTRELIVMQGLIEDLLRIRANQMTMEIRALDYYLPQTAKMFLPAKLRPQFLEEIKMGMYNLTNSVPA
jgi:hypothetical protein